jgi:hypothetical protein
MVFLSKYNKYLRDSTEIDRTVLRNAEASSQFEGASSKAFHASLIQASSAVSASPSKIASSEKRDNKV